VIQARAGWLDPAGLYDAKIIVPVRLSTGALYDPFRVFREGTTIDGQGGGAEEAREGEPDLVVIRASSKYGVKELFAGMCPMPSPPAVLLDVDDAALRRSRHCYVPQSGV